MFDTQTPLTYDYNYQTQIFEILKNLPVDLCIDEESFMKDIIAQQGQDAQKNYLNETDFFMSKYKSASIQEVAVMFKEELRELKEQKEKIQNLSSKLNSKGGGDQSKTEQARYEM